MTELRKARLKRCDARNTFTFDVVSYAADVVEGCECVVGACSSSLGRPLLSACSPPRRPKVLINE
jgi:hypothetical protein